MSTLEYQNPSSGATAVLESVLVAAGPPEVRREFVVLAAGSGVSGGTTIKHLVSAASTNLTNVKASAGMLYGWDIFNATDATLYVKFHNTSGAPTAGTGVVRTIAIQAGQKATYFNEYGIYFSTGISFSTVTGIADADTAAVAASSLVIDLDYN